MIVRKDTSLAIGRWVMATGDYRCTLCQTRTRKHEWVDFNDQTMEIVDCSNVTKILERSHAIAHEALTRRRRAME